MSFAKDYLATFFHRIFLTHFELEFYTVEIFNRPQEFSPNYIQIKFFVVA